MATATFFSPGAAHGSLSTESRESYTAPSRFPFLRTTSHQLQSSSSPLSFAAARRAESRVSKLYRAPCAKKSHLDRIPKQFREENLTDGLKDNYKNVPSSLYGLSPSQLAMFTGENNLFSRLSASVTEESISSARSYSDLCGGVLSSKGLSEGHLSPYNMGYSSRGRRVARRRRRRSPPNIPSLVLASRVIYLGLPIVSAVSQLIVAEFRWLTYEDPTKPIYLYINCPGTQNESKESIAFETDAYAIADWMLFCDAVYTVNLARAYGQAAMLFSLGKKGHRGLLRGASTKLYLPAVNRSSGAVSDMWIKAKELNTNARYYLDLLSQGTGRPQEVLLNDIQHSRFFNAQEAIDYGIADRILESLDSSFSKKEFEALEQARRKRLEAANTGPSFLLDL
ncbi:hypothetical protein Dimus_026384 [Dionaea muscipula]